MTTLFHVGPKGFNIGNHAIGLAMREVLNDAFGRVFNVISIPATSRYEVHSRAGLTAATIHEINQFGHGVIVGGGNLYENGELDVDLDALDALDVPLMLFSLSWGRVYNRQRKLTVRTDAMPDRVIRALNARADVSLARDQATVRHLHAVGADHAMLGGCPTLFMHRVGHLLPELPGADLGVAFVSVRNPSLMNVPLDVQIEVPALIRDIVELLRDAGYREVRLLCHDHRDIPFAASLPDVNYTYTDDVATYAALLRSCAVNVTFRLHSALPCLSFGRPFIKLSYDERSLSLMDTVGLSEWNIDLVNEPDPLGAIRDRHADLGRLESLVAGARETVAGLGETLAAGCRAFARAAEACHAEATP